MNTFHPDPCTIGVDNENDRTHFSMQAYGKEKGRKTTKEIIV
jgi:hypothetical protein